MTLRPLLFLLVLVPGLVIACGDDGGGGDPMDAGTPEGGADDAGAVDTGPPVPATTDHCAYEPVPATARAGGTVAAGAIRAGAAEAVIDLPIGSALGAYTARADFMGTTFKVDDRYVEIAGAFNSSVGVESAPMARAIAITAADETIVWVKADLGIADEAITFEIARRLGPDFAGKVLYTVSHSHSGWGHWSVDAGMQVGFGATRASSHEALITQLVAVAQAALDARVDARIGVGYDGAFDSMNVVTHDRRGENDELAGGSFKDHHLFVIRIDTTEGVPLALVPIFGMHGIVMDADNPLASTDAPGAVERALEEAFDTEVVVMHAQGAGGDVSPGGSGGIECPDFDITRANAPCYNFARAETVGRYARDLILAAWTAAGDAMQSSMPIEMVTRVVPLGPDWDTFAIRDGALRYAPFDRRRIADRMIFDEATGDILSPIDEFSSPVGAALCGEDHDAFFPRGQMRGTRGLLPYRSCMMLDEASVQLGALILLAFDADPDADEDHPAMPVCAGTRSTISALRLGDYVMAAMPGEVTTLYADYIRSMSPVDEAHTIVLGYAQDAGGYLLVAEDWLLAGYEPSINFWGPLEGEYLGERADELMDLVMTDTREDAAAGGTARYAPVLAADDIPAADPAPLAGTVPSSVPGIVYARDAAPITTAQPAASIRRLGSAYFTWIGEDPLSGTPRLVLEREEPAGSGTFVPVRRRSGRPVVDQDVLLTHTPDPLVREGTAARTHYYVAEWQAVTPWGTLDADDVSDRPGVPLGRYRFHVRGTGYDLTSNAFEVTPGAVDVTAMRDGTALALSVGYLAPDGWRLLHLQQRSNERVTMSGGTVTVEVTLSSGGPRTFTDVPVGGDGSVRVDLAGDAASATAVRVVDRFGNAGMVAL
jgi:hypothetical protein